MEVSRKSLVRKELGAFESSTGSWKFRPGEVVVYDEPTKMGPLKATHPLVAGAPLDGERDTCPACGEVFREGQYVTLIPVGPGSDETERAKARDGRPYNAVAVTVHWECATGGVVEGYRR